MQKLTLNRILERFDSENGFPPEKELRREYLVFRHFSEALEMLEEHERDLFMKYYGGDGIDADSKYNYVLINHAGSVITEYLARFGISLDITKASVNDCFDDFCEDDYTEIPDVDPSCLPPWAIPCEYDEYQDKAASCHVDPEDLYALDNPVKRIPSSASLSDKELYRRIKDACIKRDIPLELSSRIVMSVISYIRSGSCQPILLVGKAGTGKTYFAQVLADVMGLEFFKISGPGAASGRGLTGDSGAYKSPRFGEIANAMIRTGTPNPVILIDEIDKSSQKDKFHCLGDELLSCLDGSRTIYDNFLEKHLDTSSIPFVLTANVKELIPEWLIDRCMLIDFPDPDTARISSILEKHIAELRKEKLYEGRLVISRTALKSVVETMRGRGIVSLRQYTRMLDSACLEAFREMCEDPSDKKRIVVKYSHLNKAMNDIMGQEHKKKTAYHIGFAV